MSTHSSHSYSDGSMPMTRNEQIVALRRQGLTLQAIGDRFALTRERVRQISDAHGVKRRDATAGRRISRRNDVAGDIDHALSRWRCGDSVAAIAADLRLHAPTL